jgi:nucleoside-diphosphate-sugar epimerase
MHRVGAPHQGMDSKPHSVLVTGSSGFIGSHVVCQLHTAGHRVTALDILKPKFPLPDGVEFRQCDIRQDHFPCSPYALTKLIGEQRGRLYASLHDLRFVSLLFFSVWRPGQRPDLALEAFTRRIVAGQPVVINGDRSQRRDLEPVVRIYNHL